MPEININYLAVLVSALISFGLGSIWYNSAVFGKQWMAAIGKTEEELTKGGGMAMIFILTLVIWLIAAYVLAVVISFAKAADIGSGLIVGFLCWFGFNASLGLMNSLYERQNTSLWLINSGYTLVALLISGAILGAWK